MSPSKDVDLSLRDSGETLHAHSVTHGAPVPSSTSLSNSTPSSSSTTSTTPRATKSKLSLAGISRLSNAKSHQVRVFGFFD